jgi:TonB family protein
MKQSRLAGVSILVAIGIVGCANPPSNEEPIMEPVVQANWQPIPKAIEIHHEVAGQSYTCFEPPPQYPAESRRAHEQGTVLLQVTMSTKGTFEKAIIQTSSGHILLDHAALVAVRGMTCQPFLLAGQPQPTTFRLPVVFQLNASPATSLSPLNQP